MAHGAVEKFTVAVPESTLADLKERLARTRFPTEVSDSGWTYGTNLSYLKELLEYWRTAYDWRSSERVINSFSNFKVDIDGCKVHFIHQPAKGPNPKPLLLLHGWPGSIAEFLEIIPMLTDPASYGGDPADALTVIAPSLPGYGFSDDPRVPGVSPEKMASMFNELMTEVLGYKRYAVQGGDWGAMIGSILADAYSQNVIGLHLNMVGFGPPGGRRAMEMGEEEKRFLEGVDRFRREETGYQEIQGTKPQTLAYGLNDSPAGLAAWIIEKFRTWSDCGGNPERACTKDQLLTNITIYWVTQSINSSTRLYYESRHHPYHRKPGTRVEVPTAIAMFPKELIQTPRKLAEKSYNVRRWTEFPVGGHFAAMEQPKMVADDVRAFFRELRPG